MSPASPKVSKEKSFEAFAATRKLFEGFLRYCHERKKGILLGRGGKLSATQFVNIRIAADSTMLRMVNLLIALSLGVHLEQFEHRIGLT